MPEIQVLEKVRKFITPGKIGKPLKVLFVATEVAPFAQVGGIGQVMFYLPKALRKLGVDARVFMPKYALIDEEKDPLMQVFERLKVHTQDSSKPFLICNVKYFENEREPVYFLENQEYYELRANVYGYSDDHVRWALLSLGALEFILQNSKLAANGKNGQAGWVPDIIHCNDWHTGLIANYLKTVFAKNPILSEIATVFTIHNINFQGMFDHKNVSELDFDDGKSPIPSFFDNRLSKINFMRRGIIYSDLVNTVSETYSREILTPQYGEGLEGLLQELRSKLFGVPNGLDYQAFNPATDNLLVANFDINSIEKKSENKKSVQKEFSLPPDPQVCLLSYVGRLDSQKGIELIINVIPKILRDFGVQFVAIGGGALGFKEALEQIQKKFPSQVGLHLYPNFTLPRLVFGGSDIFLAPAKFEPAGLTQLEAMRYGAVPVVRATGGLGDTVEDINLETGTGTGFVFKQFDPFAFHAAIVRAITLWQIKSAWDKIVKSAMSVDFSWEASAESYIKLYTRAIDFAKGVFEKVEEY